MYPSKSDERPIFWIVGGPNGSGKSSLYEDARIEDFGRSVWIINPDLLTRRILRTEGLGLREANLEAVKRIEKWLGASIKTHKTVGVETVLSTKKYRRLVRMAKRYSFEIRLIYVLLDTPDRSIERVRLRVSKGGHDVPAAKIRERYYRSVQQLPWFVENADRMFIFDNSGSKPVLVGVKKDGTTQIDPSAPEAVLEVFRKPTRPRKTAARLS